MKSINCKKSYFSFESAKIHLFCISVALASSFTHAAATPANPVYVDTKATNGDGSSGNPWTGWDSTITTWTPGTAYIFRQGWYAYSGTPAGWTQSNMQLIGQPGTVLKCVGCTGAVVSMSNTTNRPQNIHMENFILDGNGTAAEGLVLAGPSRSEFNNIRIRNVTTNGFHLTYNILNTFTNPKVATAGETSSTVHYMPAVAMLIDGGSSANTIINPIFEGINPNYLNLATQTQIGFKLAGTAIQNVIIGGTAESLVTGIALCTDSGDVNCSKNTFTGIDLEGNSSNDIVLGIESSPTVHVYSNQFNNVIGDSTPTTGKTVQVTTSATSNQFIGGEYSSILEHGQYNTFVNASISSTDSAHLEGWFNNGTVINMRNLSGGTNVTSRMPMNSQFGNYGNGLNNIYSYSTNITSFSSPVSIPTGCTSGCDALYEKSISINSSIPASVSKGATVTAGYADAVIDKNITISGYVDPGNPGYVVIRWLVRGGVTSPQTGNYKITVMQ